VAEGAIAERTLPESLSFIAIYGIDPAVVRPCHGGQVNEASNDVNHRSHCPPGFDSLYTCDQWTRTGSTTAPMRTRKPINMYTTITTTENSCANPSDLVFASVAHRSLLSATSRPLRARNPDESIHVLPVPVRHLEGAVDGCTRTFWDACLGNARDRRATPSRRSGALQFGDTGWVSSPPKPGSETLGKRHLCDCRPGWEAKARPRVRSSTHSSQRLVSATCQPLQWSRLSAENSSPRARPPDYDESSARRDHQASAAVIALSASWMPSPTSPAVAAQCKGIRATAPGSQRCSSRVSGSGAVPS
jgi:hypothetical protein